MSKWPRVCGASGIAFYDLAARTMAFTATDAPVLAGDSLNGLMALPSADRVVLRRRVSELLGRLPAEEQAAIAAALPAFRRFLAHQPLVEGSAAD